MVPADQRFPGATNQLPIWSSPLPVAERELEALLKQDLVYQRGSMQVSTRTSVFGLGTPVSTLIQTSPGEGYLMTDGRAFVVEDGKIAREILPGKQDGPEPGNQFAQSPTAELDSKTGELTIQGVRTFPPLFDTMTMNFSLRDNEFSTSEKPLFSFSTVTNEYNLSTGKPTSLDGQVQYDNIPTDEAYDSGDGTELPSTAGGQYHNESNTIELLLTSSVWGYINTNDKYDILTHEAAHALYGAGDSTVDGFGIGMNAADQQIVADEYVRLQAVYDADIDGDGVADGDNSGITDYPFDSRSRIEFWATVSELFLNNEQGRNSIRNASPALYAVLERYYGSSPVA